MPIVNTNDHKWRDLLGLPREFDFHRLDNIQLAATICKRNMIVARNVNDDDQAKLLSQCKQFLINKKRVFCECGKAKAKSSRYCPECRRANIARGKFGMTVKETPAQEEPKFELFKIEPGVPFPVQAKDALTHALRQLKLANVGDSFVCKSGSQTIRNTASEVGVQVRIYPIDEDKETGKKINRVWKVEPRHSNGQTVVT